MEFENKIKIIERYDGYFSGINNKGAFILAINTLVLSGFLIGLKDIMSLVNCQELALLKLTIGAIVFCSLASMVVTIYAILPYLDSGKKSFWFFNDVANRGLADLTQKIDIQSEGEKNNDLNEQIYYLAKGLKKKHVRIRIALIFNLIQMVLIAIVSYLILC